MHSQPPPLPVLCLSYLKYVFFSSMHSQSCVNLGLSLFSKGWVMDSFGFLEFCWFLSNLSEYSTSDPSYLHELSFIGKDVTNDFEDMSHNDDAREMMEKYVIGEVDVTTVPTRRLYIAPGLGGTNPKDEKPGFLIKILQLLVPLLILGLALVVWTYTKKE